MSSIDCTEFRAFIDPYLDCEFDDQERALFDAHLAVCGSCRNYYEQQSFLRKAVKPALKRPCRMPQNARLRLEQKLRGVRRPQRAKATALALAKPVTMMAAVGVLFLFVAPLTGFSSSVVEDVVDQHCQTMPVEVPSPEASEVNRWFSDKLPFRMATPRFQDQRVTLLGGRLSRVRTPQDSRSSPAAHLIYRVGHHKMSVLIFDGRHQIPLLDQTEPNSGPIVKEIRGHRVALYRRGGLTYAVTSTLPVTDMMDVMGTSL